MVEARLAGRVKREDMEMGGRQDEVVARQATALRDTQLIDRSFRDGEAPFLLAPVSVVRVARV